MMITSTTSANKLAAGAYGNVIDKIEKAFTVGAETAKKILQVSAHGLIGGLRSVVNGGKFLAGFVSGAIGKAVTLGSQW